MKLIKKIAAIMFAFMMVVSMGCNIKAVEGTSPETTGTLTINYVKENQTYKLYKILDLESFSGDNYSYTIATGWEGFFKSGGEGATYMENNENGYISFKKGMDAEDNLRKFAQKALEYATNKKITPVETFTTTTGQTTITKDSLDLGYYLLDSSVGTLCSLSSSQPNVTIDEKNGVPSVDKIITSGGVVFANGKSNSASIDDTVYFQTTITAQPGAQNYVLHDKMTEGLTFDQNSVNVSLHKNAQNTDRDLSKTTDYSVETTNLESTDPKCTFHINFSKKLCDGLEADDTITVTYSAVLNEKAVIGNVDKNKNETWLKYGENNNLETTHPTTDTKTFEMNVFKFYKDNKNSDKETGLADAKFTLSKNQNGTDPIKLIDKGSNTYRVAKTDETNTITEVITPDNGRFTIQGLGAGTYYLTETKQPAGYNKLKDPVTVVIDENGKVRVGESEANPVKVENKTGTVLPSTGGAGTTMIYLVGALLVLGSGVVLATKRRVKNK
ncbi:MAG: SpaH/EbpB family LPXTG-anchored major pilin [Holdemanella porci]|uniref:SpaH/EbpB family LPXTG-anchored major pilin n=1 Tax=Holdemanella TaxID=1573535 RepID=UPI003993B6CF